MTEGNELSNQEKIRILGEKETYKYLGILEADTITQVEVEPEWYTWQNYIAETLSKGYKNRIWFGKMCCANNNKLKKTNNGRNRSKK